MNDYKEYMAKKENTTPYEISEVYEKGPRVKGPRSRTDWDFLVYELKKMDITPGEAYRIVAEKKGNTNIRFQWKMMRFTMYVWERLHESEKMFQRPKIDTVREVVSRSRFKAFFRGYYPDLDFDHEKEVKLLNKLIAEKPQQQFLTEGNYYYPGTKKIIPQKVLDRILQIK